MAERDFHPTSFGVRPNFHAEIIEKRLSHSGEYVNHFADGVDGDKVQQVVMNYQYIPQDASTPQDYLLSGTNPTLYGYIGHFDDKPEPYHDGNGVHAPTGSQFEVRGILYNVKRVDVNHNGSVIIELSLVDNCETVRADFDEEMSELLCEPECADIPEINDFAVQPNPRIYKQC